MENVDWAVMDSASKLYVPTQVVPRPSWDKSARHHTLYFPMFIPSFSMSRYELRATGASTTLSVVETKTNDKLPIVMENQALKVILDRPTSRYRMRIIRKNESDVEVTLNPWLYEYQSHQSPGQPSGGIE